MAKRYTAEDIEFIKNNLDKGNKELGEILGRSADSIKDRMCASGLRRTREQLKGLRRKNNKGQFKKGNTPHNTNYNGHERITVDGYIEVRVKKGVYRLKHLYEWEKVNGALLSGYCLRCVDGNILNTEPSNWKMISRAENMVLNSIHRYPKEVKRAIRLVKKIEKQL